MSGVSGYLQEDHARIDALLEGIPSLVSAASFAEAKARFSGFVGGLARHIDVEEGLLFPTFEELTGMTMGPTVVMRREHAELRRLWEAVSDALERKDGAGFLEPFEALLGLLGAHNQKEERMLYPMTDRALGDDAAREALVGQLREALEG